ncbi:MAG: radical SAM protein [Promethearchaeota archaeon]
MIDVNRLLQVIKEGKADWSDYEEFLAIDNKDLEPFLLYAKNITLQNFQNNLKIYIPNKRFPAISVTGGECALECTHCDKKYLNGMEPILNNDDLKKYLLDLSENGGTGVLLSGGCDSDGSVPLLNYLDTIKEVKKKTNLIINTHTGLLNELTAKKLAEVNVDIISFDINMDDKIIKDIYHLDKDLSDYERAIDLLKKYKLNIVPHICIGLFYGELHKELESIRFIREKDINPSLIVLIALIPPKNSKILFKRPSPEDIAKVIATIRFIFPTTEISLGCMRPRGEIKVDLEKYAIKAGITRLEIPSKTTLTWLKKVNPEINLKFYSACCAIPKEFDDITESKNSDIRGYLSI